MLNTNSVLERKENLGYTYGSSDKHLARKMKPSRHIFKKSDYADINIIEKS